MAQKPINEKTLIKNMTQDDLYKEIYKLPKTDLHCHLDGSLRLDTIISLIKKNGMPYPVDRDQLRKLVVKDDPEFIKNGSLGDYLQAFGITTSVMQDQESLEQIAYEVAEDAAQEAFVGVWLDLPRLRELAGRFSPPRWRTGCERTDAALLARHRARAIRNPPSSQPAADARARS